MTDDYARGLAVFSGDDLKAIRQTDRHARRASTAVGVRHPDGVVLVTGTRSDQSPLMDGDDLEAVFHVGDHAGLAASGRAVGTHQIVEQLRDAAVDEIERYGRVEDIKPLLTEIVDDRHFGVDEQMYGTALLLGGTDGDGETRLYKISSHGVVTSWSAAAVGRHSEAVLQHLEDEYPDCSSVDDYLSLSIDSVLQNTNLSPAALSVAEITEHGYRTVPTTELETDTTQV